MRDFDLDSVGADRLLPFRYRRVDESFFLTSGLGEWVILEPAEFTAFVQGELPTDGARFAELAAKGFIAAEIPPEAYRDRWWEKREHTQSGPNLHAFVLTERCDHRCQYCHASVVGMDRVETDMSKETAERCVDFALKTTAPQVTIEFQGGEPLANWDVLEHVVVYAQQQNRTVGKDLAFSLVTNTTMMTEERLDFLVENRVQICTSIDGPQAVHDKVRITKSGSSWENACRWVRRINERYAALGLDSHLYRAEALPTITRHALPYHRELIDTYVDLGCRAIFLRNLDPFGLASVTSDKLGYPTSEFLEFYERAVDYIIELNRQGVQVMERLAAIMLAKMIGAGDPNYLDLRSPCGAAIGQLAYHPSGRLYSCDEGRMVAASGDEAFCLGHVGETEYGALMESPRVRALVTASTVDALPGCESCAYAPYCGVCPVHSYATQGSIQGRMPSSSWCEKHMGVFDYLVRKLARADEKDMAMFQRWATNRRLDHFLQPTT